MKNTDKDELPTFFVSRRGRQVGVHEVDLSDIDIESSDVPTAASSAKKSNQKAKPAKPPKPPKSPRQRSNWSKKKLLLVIMVVAVALLPLILAELVTAQYRSGITSAKADLQIYVDKTVLPAQKKTTISADQVQSFAHEVNGIVGSMCRGGLLDNASGLYPRAKSALDDCRATQSKYAALANSLYGLEAQARYLEKVDALVKPVATPITDEYAVLGAQQTAWQTLSEELKKLSPPEKLKTAHIVLLSEVAAVADAWSKLNTANNSQDAAAFVEAEKTLTSKYEAVRGTSGAFSEVLAETQIKITTNYNALK